MNNANGCIPVSVVSCDHISALIGRGLGECGLAVGRAEDAGGGCLEMEIRGIPAAPVSSLLVTDHAAVHWESCTPDEAGGQDPRRVADIVTALLADQAPPYEQADGEYGRMLSCKSAAGRELEARGFSVELIIHRDEDCFDAWADISVSRAGQRWMCAVVDDSECITWDAGYPVTRAAAGPPGSLAGTESIAADVVARIGRLARV